MKTMTKKELKTLKDIEGDYCPQCKLWSDAINPADLKHVAIRHIKDLDKNRTVKNDLYNEEIIIWIKQFFNIIEEDLK